jgi:hypothetical protein
VTEQRGGQHEPGPLAEEAAKFIGAAQEWLHRVVLDPSTARVSTGSQECCWCPLCQLVCALRGERPELRERLGDVQVAVTGLLSALGQAAGQPGPHQDQPDHDQPDQGRADQHHPDQHPPDHDHPGQGRAEQTQPGQAGATAAAPAARVRKIDLSDGQDG